MAKTTAIDSKQCRRAKPEGASALLHVSKENARTEWINCAVLISGEKPGRGTIFLHLIRILWEISRTADDFCGLHPGTRGGIPDEQYTLAVFWAKSVQAVSKNDVKR